MVFVKSKNISMTSVELAKKYVIDVPCKHCKGSGKCNCSSCQYDRANNYMMVWRIRNPRPLPFENEKTRMHNKEALIEFDKSREWAKSVDKCPKCAGKGIRPEINMNKLDNKVQSGIITEHEKFAIIQELGNTFGDYYFQY
jgi:DnaJ-class molecular chaperone